MFFNDHIVLVGKPLAGFKKVLIQIPHYQVDRTYRIRHTHKTPTSVPAHVERKARVTVIMKRTQAFMSRDLESQPLRDPLNRQVAELL